MGTKIKDEILDILGECRVDGNILYLPDRQLDRATYVAVNKVLENIGGKWNKKAKGHVFDNGDPAELLDDTILSGEIIDKKKVFQFFPTPRDVAIRVCDLAELDENSVVLEPSCGKGDLADVIYERGVKEVFGLELNKDMSPFLKDKPYQWVVGSDFMTVSEIHVGVCGMPYTHIIQNPPFTRQQDIDHVMKAYELLPSGGILVSVMSESPFFRTNKKSVEFREFLENVGADIDCVDAGAFKESGTMIRTRIVKIKKG